MGEKFVGQVGRFHNYEMDVEYFMPRTGHHVPASKFKREAEKLGITLPHLKSSKIVAYVKAALKAYAKPKGRPQLIQR